MSVVDHKWPLVVAELNSSHRGDLGAARSMIKSAKHCGASGVKFQSWSEKSLYSEEFLSTNPISRRMFAKFSMRSECLKELASYSSDIGIAFASTPYSYEEIDFLVEHCSVPYLKIASMDLVFHDFIEYASGTGLPLVLSTGMSNEHDIVEAVERCLVAGCTRLMVLHCVSLYPCPDEKVNLRNVELLRDLCSSQFVSIGYSDHSQNIIAPAVAVSLGAEMIERHFSLDRSQIGFDNNMATEPNEFKQMVDLVHEAEILLGSNRRMLSQAELANAKLMRRSAIAAKNLDAGTSVTDEDVEFLRPGGGISPNRFKDFLGKKLSVSIKKGVSFKENDFL